MAFRISPALFRVNQSRVRDPLAKQASKAAPNKRGLRTKMGEVLDSDDRAETFAQHFEEAQWHTRIVTEPSSSCCLGGVLPVCMDKIS